MLRVDESVVLGLIERFELPAIQIGEGGPWRIEREVLEDYIDDRYEVQRLGARPLFPHAEDLAELWPEPIPEDVGEPPRHLRALDPPRE